MNRRHFASLAAALVGLAAVASGPAAAQSKVVWKASDVHPLGYPTVEAIVRMGKKLETATNGRISIQMYPSMQLGGEKEMIEQAQVGALQIARISVGAMGPVVDELNVFNMPFMFRDEAHMRKVIDGPIGAGDARQDHRHAGRAWWRSAGWTPARATSTPRSRCTKPADLKGHEDPHDGQPAVRRDDERDGRQRRRDGLQRALSARCRPAWSTAPRTTRRRCSRRTTTTVGKVYSLTGHLIIPEIFVFSKVTWDKLLARTTRR